MKHDLPWDFWIGRLESEINGLLKFDVMDVHPVESLPRSAKLLSSICSYRRKRLPNGDLLKYKSRICVNNRSAVITGKHMCL